MITCSNCRRPFPGVYPLYCGCGAVTGRTVEERYDLMKESNLWTAWHARLAEAVLSAQWNEKEQRQWYESKFVAMIPRTDCNCRENYRKLAKACPVDWSSARAAFESSVEHHRIVSEQHLQSPKPGWTQNQAAVYYLGERSSSPRALVTIATHKYRQILAESRESLVRYAQKCEADYFELTDALHPDWRVEKFRTHKIARAYDQTLFVDADCWINEDCENLFDLVPTGCVAMHNDYWKLRDRDWSSMRSLVYASQGITERADLSYAYNSGVVMCSRETADIWEPPTASFPGLHIAEQLLVEHRASKHKVVELPSTYNWQWWFEDFAEGKASAKLVHFASSPSRLADVREYRLSKRLNV